MVLNKLSSRRICRPEISVSPGLVMLSGEHTIVASSIERAIKINSDNKSWNLRLLDDGVVFLTEVEFDQSFPSGVIMQDSLDDNHYRLFITDNGDVKTEIIILDEEGGNMYA